MGGIAVVKGAGKRSIAAYFFVGLVLWVAVLKSGIHATLAGVVLALFIPIRPDDEGGSPLRQLEHDLHPVVAFGILPLFAFANAGVSLSGMSFRSLLDPVPVGIVVVLVVRQTVALVGLTA